MKNWILILGIFFSSCDKNDNCIPHATCKDESFQFGTCDSVCKGIGIKFYYECEKNGTTIIKRSCI